MVFLQEYALDTFFKGLIIGVITGVVLNKVPNYIYSLIRNNRIIKDEVKSNSKPEPVSSTKDEYKMALLVRHDLKMGKGKVAAQCSHAMVHSYEAGLKLIPGVIANWELSGRQVDVFKIADEETMLKISDLAAAENFNVYIVVDAGRTQVAPKSKTVMAIGPAKCSQLDEITREFEIYS
ncbi:peptidyl-tRNA hydrolase 2, mitochondrial-like isoform X1 [Adelges cooleyi]|uniref:peptidyl-tRNA hydrolase 2, mitochondrial-like isoform X1 n=1 Tax=Adelges cooleyi TaxID=133065 RepID=UPI00217F9457|nr:peptidyl-tRNA hydrolase 2, mitochondrial-like isoform X1 [Adelges cooleyi]